MLGFSIYAHDRTHAHRHFAWPVGGHAYAAIENELPPRCAGKARTVPSVPVGSKRITGSYSPPMRCSAMAAKPHGAVFLYGAVFAAVGGIALLALIPAKRATHD